MGCSPSNHAESMQLNEQGVTHLNQHQLPKAHAAFVEAWKQQPQNPETLYNLASTYHRHGQEKPAEQFYRQALQVKPDFPECRHNYHVLLISQSRLVEAREDAQSWSSQQPGSADALAEVGWLTRLQGDLPAAQKPLQQALAIDPHHTTALLELGKVYQEYHLDDRARVLYGKVLKHDPENQEAKTLLTGLKK